MVTRISLKAIYWCEGNFLHQAAFMEGVRNYGITRHCYRFLEIFNNANRLAVRSTTLKDMVYSLALYSAVLILGF